MPLVAVLRWVKMRLYLHTILNTILTHFVKSLLLPGSPQLVRELFVMCKVYQIQTFSYFLWLRRAYLLKQQPLITAPNFLIWLVIGLILNKVGLLGSYRNIYSSSYRQHISLRKSYFVLKILWNLSLMTFKEIILKLVLTTEIAIIWKIIRAVQNQISVLFEVDKCMFKNSPNYQITTFLRILRKLFFFSRKAIPSFMNFQNLSFASLSYFKSFVI